MTPADGDRGVTPTPEHTGRDPRLRPTAVILGVGVGVAVLAAVVIGALGGAGSTSAVVLLLLLAASCGVAALYAWGTALVDDARGRPIGRSRIVLGVVLFLASAVFLLMTIGAGG